MVFLEPILDQFCSLCPEEYPPHNFLYAPHRYDLDALFKKQSCNITVNMQGLSRVCLTLTPYVYKECSMSKRSTSAKAVQEPTTPSDCSRSSVVDSFKNTGARPVVVGECGVPMDLNEGEGFQTGDWTWKARMMDALISGLGCCTGRIHVWNYSTHNDDTPADYWNGEHFSFYSLSSPSQQSLLRRRTRTGRQEAGRRRANSGSLSRDHSRPRSRAYHYDRASTRERSTFQADSDADTKEKAGPGGQWTVTVRLSPQLEPLAQEGDCILLWALFDMVLRMGVWFVISVDGDNNLVT